MIALVYRVAWKCLAALPGGFNRSSGRDILYPVFLNGEKMGTGISVISGTRKNGPAWGALFFMILAGFLPVSSPAVAKTLENCIKYSMDGYYIDTILGREKIGSSSLKMEAQLSIDPFILLFSEKTQDNNISNDIEYNNYKIIHIYGNCESNIINLFLKTNKPIFLTKKENIYIYFKSSDNHIYNKNDTNISYSASFYKINYLNGNIKKIEINDEFIKALDEYGWYFK